MLETILILFSIEKNIFYFSLYQIIIIIIFLLTAIAYTTLYKRKVLAIIQKWNGLNTVVVNFRIVQLLVDLFKWILKKTLVLATSNKRILFFMIFISIYYSSCINISFSCDNSKQIYLDSVLFLSSILNPVAPIIIIFLFKIKTDEQKDIKIEEIDSLDTYKEIVLKNIDLELLNFHNSQEVPGLRDTFLANKLLGILFFMIIIFYHLKAFDKFYDLLLIFLNCRVKIINDHDDMDDINSELDDLLSKSKTIRPLNESTDDLVNLVDDFRPRFPRWFYKFVMLIVIYKIPIPIYLITIIFKYFGLF